MAPPVCTPANMRSLDYLKNWMRSAVLPAGSHGECPLPSAALPFTSPLHLPSSHTPPLPLRGSVPPFPSARLPPPPLAPPPPPSCPLHLPSASPRPPFHFPSASRRARASSRPTVKRCYYPSPPRRGVVPAAINWKHMRSSYVHSNRFPVTLFAQLDTQYRIKDYRHLIKKCLIKIVSTNSSVPMVVWFPGSQPPSELA